LLTFFNVSELFDIRWAHAVNDESKLLECFLNDKNDVDNHIDNSTNNNNNSKTFNSHSMMIHMIEADVGFCENKAVMAHDQPTKDSYPFSNLLHTLVERNKTTTNHKIGLKIDFKDPRAVSSVLNELGALDWRGEFPVWLNCDALQGPGGRRPLFDFKTFVEQCDRFVDSTILSIGWTTGADAAVKKYTAAMVEEMLRLVDDAQQQRQNKLLLFTFPVRASFLLNDSDADNVLALLLQPDTKNTLTVWGEADIDTVLSTIRDKNLPFDEKRVFIDVQQPRSDLS
jgi:hypothetical protein